MIVESAIPDSVIAQLKALGHEVSIARPSQFGGSQAIIKLAARLRGGVGSAKGWARGRVLSGLEEIGIGKGQRRDA